MVKSDICVEIKTDMIRIRIVAAIVLVLILRIKENSTKRRIKS